MTRTPPNPAPPQTRSVIGGVIAAIVVVALALAFVMRPRAAGTQAPSQPGNTFNGTQAAPPAPAASTPTTATLPDMTEQQLAAVPRISVEDVLKDGSKGVVIIDVRDAESYLASHIDGALHIPVSYLQGEIQYLPRDGRIITYCT